MEGKALGQIVWVCLGSIDRLEIDRLRELGVQGNCICRRMWSAISPIRYAQDDENLTDCDCNSKVEECLAIENEHWFLVHALWASK